MIIQESVKSTEKYERNNLIGGISATIYTIMVSNFLTVYEAIKNKLVYCF